MLVVCILTGRLGLCKLLFIKYVLSHKTSDFKNRYVHIYLGLHTVKMVNQGYFPLRVPTEDTGCLSAHTPQTWSDMLQDWDERRGKVSGYFEEGCVFSLRQVWVSSF